MSRQGSATKEFQQNIESAEEWLKNLKDTFPHIKDGYKEYAADRIKLLEWLIEQVKFNFKA